MMNSIIKKGYLYSLGSVIFLFLLWELLSIIKSNTFLFPSILTILSRVKDILINPNDLKILLSTFLRVIIVLVISFLVSFLLLLIYIRLPHSISFFRPIIAIFKAAPFAIISVYIFFAFETKIAPYLICFFVIFPIIFEGLIIAIDNINKEIKDEVALLQISTIKKYWYVFLPICFPYIIMTLLQSFGIGLKSMIMAEYICQIDNSVGGNLINNKYNMEFDKLLAWLIIIVLIVCLFEYIVKLIAKRIIKKA